MLEHTRDGNAETPPPPLDPPPHRYYGFDPWTKQPVLLAGEPPDVRHFRIRVGFQPRSPPWIVACGYLLGAACVEAGALAASLRVVRRGRLTTLRVVAVPYLAGGVSFFVAAVVFVCTSHRARYGEPGRTSRRNAARRRTCLGGRWRLCAANGEPADVAAALIAPVADAERDETRCAAAAISEARALWLAHDSWTRRRRTLELVASLALLCGVLLYTIMALSMCVRLAQPHRGNRRLSPTRQFRVFTSLPRSRIPSLIPCLPPSLPAS